MIEDGGNFGVAIQADVIKAVEEIAKDVGHRAAHFPEYFEKRSEAWSKVRGHPGQMKDGVQQGGGQGVAGGLAPIPDHVALIAALDTRHYHMLYTSLASARDGLALVCQYAQLNEKKIMKPKNDSGGSGSYY